MDYFLNWINISYTVATLKGKPVCWANCIYKRHQPILGEISHNFFRSVKSYMAEMEKALELGQKGEGK